MAQVSGAQRAAPGSTSERRRRIAFVGFMGAGKTRAARAVADELGLGFADSDELLEQRLGEPISSYFERSGEAAFREVEEELALELLTGDLPGAEVIALGGGAVTSERVRNELGGDDVVSVYLETDAESAWERVQGSDRPLARHPGAFGALLAEREPLYESVAQAFLPAAREQSARRAAGVLRLLARPEAPGWLRLIWAVSDSGEYPVVHGPGGLEASGLLWPAMGAGRPVCITDEHVAPHHLAALMANLAAIGLEVGSIAVPAGEAEKSLARAEEVLRALAQRGVERSDCLVALGGGVVGDLAGFCAATYQRGIACVQVPTTLVAQVDSAYGGKTGVDLPEAKNYVGAYHQPSAVLCDPSLLSTLPDPELRAGYSEVLKTALIAGGWMWESLRTLPPVVEAVRSGSDAFERVAVGCIRTKLAVVAADERDQGSRAALNLGHTVGHAIEAAAGYGSLRHGEAVGLGLLAALRLSEQVVGLDAALRDEVLGLLEKSELPTRLEGAAPAAVVERCGLDKKRSGGRANLVLLAAPGDVRTGQQAPEGALEAAVEELT